MGVSREEDSGQTTVMVGAGEAGTSCPMGHFPSVPGMASHMAILLLPAGKTDEFGTCHC